eukprot:5691-Heterococcus_DN1.PRE.1
MKTPNGESPVTVDASSAIGASLNVRAGSAAPHSAVSRPSLPAADAPCVVVVVSNIVVLCVSSGYTCSVTISVNSACSCAAVSLFAGMCRSAP